MRWLCCHLGAREHFAIPRALHRLGALDLLVTDAWVPRNSALGRVPGRLSRRLRERFHEDLKSANVRALNGSLLRYEAAARLRGRTGWEAMTGRNEWFQQAAAGVLSGYRASGPRTVVFAHSYSARVIFRLARQRGWTTVLGQIDPGEAHFAVERQVAGQAPRYGPAPAPPPPGYFDGWHEECALADRIVVNSQWSRQAVAQSGVAADKLHVVPLGYDPGATAQRRGAVPAAFSLARPLRLLFVGNASVVKGAAALLDAMALLADQPATLRIVGDLAMTVPPEFAAHPAIEWLGAVPRGEVGRHYLASDVLVFPSHSDGFGMVQLEAQAHGLPIIASRFCGDVVRDGVNGLLLPEVTAAAIASAVRALIADPQRVARMTSQTMPPAGSGLADLGGALLTLAGTV